MGTKDLTPLQKRKIENMPREQSLVIAAVAGGASKRTAAHTAGVSKRDVSTWLRKGKNGDPIYALFFDLYRIAYRAAQRDRLERISEIGAGVTQKRRVITRERKIVAVSSSTGEILDLPQSELKKMDPETYRMAYRMVVVKDSTETKDSPPDWRAEAWRYERELKDDLVLGEGVSEIGNLDEADIESMSDDELPDMLKALGDGTVR